MAKIVMIVPTEEMRAQAAQLAARVNADIDIYHESSQTVLARAASAQSQGRWLPLRAEITPTSS